MQAPTQELSSDPLKVMIRRSDELYEALIQLLDDAEFDLSPRGEVVFGMCSVALEHGFSLRALMGLGQPTSAVGLMRLQFEALTRAMWLQYAASDLAIEKLRAALTFENEKAAKNFPSASEMIEKLRKLVRAKVPAAAHQSKPRVK